MFGQINNYHVNAMQNCFKVNKNNMEQIQRRCSGVNFKLSTLMVDLLFKQLPLARIV